MELLNVKSGGTYSNHSALKGLKWQINIFWADEGGETKWGEDIKNMNGNIKHMYTAAHRTRGSH